MKKFTMVLMFMLAVASLNAKTLIVYYSFTNNIGRIVSDLQTQIEADVLMVEPAEEGLDYAANGYSIGSALISAIRSNPNDASSYPSIKTTISNLDEYDIIIVATPLWWSNMAAPMQTFLFTYGSQMAGKNIGLIVSSSSSDISGVVSDAKRLIPNGNFLEPNLWIRSSQTSNCHSLTASWLEDIDYANLSTGMSSITDDNANLNISQGLLSAGGDVKRMTIHSTSGAKILQTSSNSVNVSSLPSGVYLVSVNKGDNTKTYKISIKH